MRQFLQPIRFSRALPGKRLKAIRTLLSPAHFPETEENLLFGKFSSVLVAIRADFFQGIYLSEHMKGSVHIYLSMSIAFNSSSVKWYAVSQKWHVASAP